MVGVDTYPVFEKNQVLNHDHLNSLITYLDDQERHTRCKLIGVGIACGLNLSIDEQFSVTVSKGCGITSEGFLLCLENAKTFTHIKSYSVPEDYTPFENISNDVYELVMSTSEGADPLSTNGSLLANKVILAYAESSDETIETCLTDNCDDHGKWRVFQLRLLVIDRSDAVSIIKASDSTLSDLSISNANDLITALNAKYRLDTGSIQRLCSIVDEEDAGEALNLSTLKTYPKVALLYAEAIVRVLEHLPDKIDAAYELFKPAFSGIVGEEEYTEAMAILAEVQEYLENVKEETEIIPLTIQYLYDLVKDLISGYDEFIDEAMDLMAACCTDRNILPRHLYLGETNPLESCEPSVFRSHFLQPPIYNGNALRLKRVASNFKRLLSMIDRYAFTGEIEEEEVVEDWPIKITPSLDATSPIGKRSIPFYFMADRTSESIQHTWDFDATRKCRAGYHLSYHSEDFVDESLTNSEFITEPLNYSIDKYPFFRIEGHLGKDAKTVYETLDTIQKTKNLPIELLMLYTGDKGTFAENSVDHGYEDLQVTYGIWRSKILMFLNNLIWLTHSIETQWETTKRKTKEFGKASKTLASTTGDKIVKKGVEKHEESQKLKDLEYSAHKNSGHKSGDYNKTIYAYNKVMDGSYSKKKDQQLLTKVESGPTEQPEKEAGYLTPEEKFLKDTLASLNKYIRTIVKSLTLDLKAFKMATFTGAYAKCIELDIEIMKYLVSKVKKEDYKDSVFFTLQIFSWIHRLLSSLAIRPYIDIRIIMDNLQNREVGTEQSQNLFDFVKENRGLEHLAGTPKGGTFVLVYQTETDSDDLSEQESEYIEQFTGKIIADFSLPYFYRPKETKRPVVTDPLAPLVFPKCMVVRPFDDEDMKILVYNENEFQIINNLYDPSVFVPIVPKETKYGSIELVKRVYEPETSKRKTIMVYQADVKKVEEALKEDPSATILIDEFDYSIQNTKDDSEVGASTFTIFLCTEPETQEKTVLTGTVYSLPPGGKKKKLAGAEIADGNKEYVTTSAADGSYSLEIPEGEYKFAATADKHNAQIQGMKIVEGTNFFDFELSEESQEENQKYGELYEEMKIKPGSKEALEVSEASKKRLGRHHQKIEEIKESEDLKPGTPIYGVSEAVDKFANEKEMNIIKINNEYRKNRDDLYKEIQRSTGKEKVLLVDAYKTLTLSYAERLALEQPQEFSKTTKTALKETREQIKASPELDMSKEVDAWSDSTNEYLPDKFIDSVGKGIAGKM